MRAYRARRREVLTDVEAAWAHVMEADRALERAETENCRLQADGRGPTQQAPDRRAGGQGAAARHRQRPADGRRANEPGPPVGLNRAARRRLDRARRSEPRG